MGDDVQCKIKIKRRIVGNQLRGRVTISSKAPIEIQHAYIEVTGLANCGWKLNAARFKFPKLYLEDTFVKGFQQFYYTRHSLCGGEISHHHRGVESYKFITYWPSRLPGTWSGDYGSIEYLAKVSIHLEKNADIYTHSQFIFAKFRRHLNSEKHLLFEGRVDVTRNFTHRSSGHVYVSVWLPISGIAAGQALPVLCSVVNHSKLHFGSLLFVLTRTDIYRSDTPVAVVKKVRTDVCRVARMVNIHQGRYDFYSIIQTDEDIVPTNQFYTLDCIQMIYEVWVSVQGSFKRYRRFGYPNIDTPGIPVIIGTKPLRNYNSNEISAEIMKKMYQYDAPIYVDELPDDFRQIIHTTEEDLSAEAVRNLERQLDVNQQIIYGVTRSASQRGISNTNLNI